MELRKIVKKWYLKLTSGGTARKYTATHAFIFFLLPQIKHLSREVPMRFHSVAEPLEHEVHFPFVFVSTPPWLRLELVVVDDQRKSLRNCVILVNLIVLITQLTNLNYLFCVVVTKLLCRCDGASPDAVTTQARAFARVNVILCTRVS